jgi:hypothetical protein
VRPEFFADDKMGKLSVGSRLTYVGLWCLADDDGWLAWDTPSIAAQLFPFESIRVRERRVAVARDELVALGRLAIHEDACGCAIIPTLPLIQKIGGNKSYQQRERHEKAHRKAKSGRVHTFPYQSDGRYVGSEVGKSRERATNDDDDRTAQLAAFRKLGLPVDVA